MSGVSGVGGAMSIDRIMPRGPQSLPRNAARRRAGGRGPGAGPAATKPASFADAMTDALKGVNDGQNEAARLSESYERGETVDIAKVMLARQQASVGFEATLQVRNKILAAYKDIMSMPV